MHESSQYNTASKRCMNRLITDLAASCQCFQTRSGPSLSPSPYPPSIIVTYHSRASSSRILQGCMRARTSCNRILVDIATRLTSPRHDTPATTDQYFTHAQIKFPLGRKLRAVKPHRRDDGARGNARRIVAGCPCACLPLFLSSSSSSNAR